MNQNPELVKALNHMLEQEHACSIRYATHAVTVTGPYADSVAARLKEIAGDELRHAAELRQRIAELGGTPSMQVNVADLKQAKDLKEILAINIEEEKQAIDSYLKIFRTIKPEDALLYETIQDIIKDEQEHLQELETLQGR
ncbi:MAG: ferritin-like domain-containing protein [Coxiellaceae bacterium]|nr:MAG: ferritin-like domain-containing protein [Coxiellaceae bacterium]